MSRTDFGKVITNFVILIVLVICLVLIADKDLLRTAMGQSKKTITHSQWKNQPVEFVKVKVAGKSINLNATSENKEEFASENKEEFDGEDDWLKGLVIHFKNRSDKNIIYIKVDLSFPETMGSGIGLAHILEFGRYPGKQNVASNDKILKPGEEVEIPLTDDDHTRMYDFLRKHNFHRVNDLDILLQHVIFEDDIMWLAGDIFKRDPFNSTKWVNINKQ
jgi:hypothetical protein